MARRQIGRAIHAHVEGRVVHIAEAALGFIQLGRGHAQVEEHPVHAVDVEFFQDLAHAVKVTVHQRDAIHVVLQTLLGGFNCRFVAVDGNEAACGKAAGDLQGVSRAA